MAAALAGQLKRRPVLWYFVLAYALTWLIEAPLVAAAQGLTDLSVPFAIHYLAAFGPMVAALVVTRVVDGRAGLRDLAQRITRWCIGAGWLLVAIGSPVALFALGRVLPA